MKKGNKFATDLIKFNISESNMEKYNKFLICFVFLSFVLFYALSFSLRAMYLVPDDGWSYYPFLFLEALMIIYSLIYDIIHKKMKYNIVDIFFFAYIFVSMIATVFSKEIIYSIVGKDGRNEGIISLIFYLLLYLLCKNNINKKNIKEYLKYLFFFGITQVIYGVLQSYFGISPCFQHMAFGFCGNPNMFGLLMTMLCVLTTSLFLKSETKKEKIIYLGMAFVFYFGVLIGESTGPFVVLCLYLMVVIIYYIIKKINMNKLIIVMAVFVFSFPIVELSLKGSANNLYHENIDYVDIYKDINNVIYRIAEKMIDLNYNEIEAISDDNIVNRSDFTSGRLTIWKLTMNIVSKKWLIGIGPDCLEIYISNPAHIYVVDKAHNNYLEVLVTTGVFGLLAYLGMIVTSVIYTIKSKNKYVIALLCGFVAYSIGIAMNISTPAVAVYYFAIMGFMIGLKDKS